MGEHVKAIDGRVRVVKGGDIAIEARDRRLMRSGHTAHYVDDSQALGHLDQLTRACIPEPFVEWQVPSLIDETDMIKCGYVNAFPTQLTLAATIAPEAIDDVVKSNRVTSESLEHRGKFLTPAACLNIYPMLGQRPPVGDMAVTALATVYRHEERGFHSLLRLWEFKVREVVLVGSRIHVLDGLERLIDAASRLAREIGINTRIEGATDHFYPTRANEVRRKMQLISNMKRELITTINGIDVSISSFNFHETHFSQPFGFDRDGEVVTGCVGFGLHRWLAALLGDGNSTDSISSVCSCHPN